ncbi:MAG: tetratricopeptide repeat protein [Chromatiales bacterium]|jgi:tetratricopeptide (TPR) repeat protein|nr:tetratricopeptide repeat protein [Chromatiales bacterium]
MIRQSRRTLLAALLLAPLLGWGPARAAPADFDAELRAIQTEWARINYQVKDADRKVADFEKLAARAAAFSASHPQRAEPLAWEGIVLSTAAGAKGGLGALSLAKQSRDRLEASLKIDPTALQGSAHTSLGTLYHKVPGFPVGFGSDKKAAEHLLKALKMNPDGIDANYFYAELLFDDGQYAEAVKYLEKARRAPPRPGRESADAGRQQEISALLTRARAKAG